MSQERTYTDYDMNVAYEEGRRAARQRSQGSGGFATVFAVIAIIIMVAVMVLTYLGISPARLTTSAPAVQPTTQPAPRVQPPAPAPQPAPIVVQNVPQGDAPQPVVIPQPAPVAQPVDAPAAAPAPKPIVIVSHEGYQQPVITGPGACAVAKGARRCGK